LPPGTGSADLLTHRATVIDAFLQGRVVPFLGAGVSLCDRPLGAVWKFTAGECPPKGWKPAEDSAARLLRPVSQATGDVSKIPTVSTEISYAGKNSGNLRSIQKQAPSGGPSLLQTSNHLAKYVLATLKKPKIT
jgi:hypothetical protein